MHKNRILLLIGLFFCIYQQSIFAKDISIIPRPVYLQLQSGAFLFDSGTRLEYNKDAKSAVNFFTSHIENVTGYNLLSKKKSSVSVVELSLNKNLDIKPEGYTLTIAEKKISITARDNAGLLHAMQTLFQLLPSIRTNEIIKLPCLEIKDYPRFRWRGMHLDVSRHFFSSETVKEYIDILAMYKLNTLHLHLTDDHGWRIEIKKYPKLTSTGAWRVDRLNVPWNERPNPRPGETPDYGGYYTQTQIKELIKYASERGITIVPEIEMPGHSQAAVASYPALSCTQTPQKTITGGIYPKDYQTSFCAGNDSVYVFLENVLSEVIELFPSKYIHIGGDEVIKKFWKQCPKCQNRMKSEGLASEDELQNYFIKRIERFLNSKGRELIGWDEILEGGSLVDNTAVMCWRNEEEGMKAVRAGHETVMTTYEVLYFDQYQAGPQGEPRAWDIINTAKKVYEYDPVPKGLTSEESKKIMGAQGNMWTENIISKRQLEYMLIPRVVALSEMTWTPLDSKNWKDFNKRLTNHFVRYDNMGWNYSRGNYTVYFTHKFQDSLNYVSLTSEDPDAEIFYTKDGTYPDKKYTAPFVLDRAATVKAVAVKDNNRLYDKFYTLTYVTHQALKRDVNYVNKPEGINRTNNVLTDGFRGLLVKDNYWQRFNKDMVATVDLGKMKQISRIVLGCLQVYDTRIFLPEKVLFETSIDGINFKKVGEIDGISNSEPISLIHDFEVNFEKSLVRYVRVSAEKLKKFPANYPWEGDIWIYSDELIIE